MAAADAILREGEEKMKKSLGVTQQELGGLRTGRAHPQLVENLKVDYYGTPTPLKQLAAVSVPDAKTIEIRPWDKNALAPVEKAFATSDLKLTPQRQGDVIRIVLPAMTQERRIEMTKLARKVGEEGRVSVRNIRHETNGRLKAARDAREISEDEFKRLTAQVQKHTDQTIANIDEFLARKEQEITTL